MRRMSLLNMLALLVVLLASRALPAAAAPRPIAPFDFTVPPVDQILDLHGDPSDPNLVVFMAGNQFMVMNALMAAFHKAHPEISRIFYETLPPGIVARQMRAGGIRMGNLVVTAQPDVFLSGKRRMRVMQREGLVAAPFAYATNVLAIEVKAGNPLHIESLRDLGRPGVRVSMPNPAWEGVAMQIERAYRKAGGEALVHTIMVTKRAAGTTLLTKIHHRQTPLYIMDGKADAGPVWISEALYQERIHNPIAMVAIPAADNVGAVYEAAMVTKVRHRRAAQDFLNFMKTPTARAIYRSYGFGQPPAARKE